MSLWIAIPMTYLLVCAAASPFIVAFFMAAGGPRDE